MARGRKLLGQSRRIPVNFTIEVDIINEFKKYCDDNCINKSAFVQQAIKKLLENNKK